MDNKIHGLQEKLAELENQLHLVLEKSDSLTNQQPISQNQASINFWSKLPKQATHEITQAVRQGTALLDKKEKNVIVFGLPESSSDDYYTKLADDKKTLEELLTAIEIKKN